MIIDITDEESVETLIRYLEQITSMSTRAVGVHSVRVWIDSVDNALKFSVDGSVWCPPVIKGKVTS